MKFSPQHCQKDYSNSRITIYYDGLFDKPKAIEFIKQSYPDFKGLVMIEHQVGYYFKGLPNYGYAVFKYK